MSKNGKPRRKKVINWWTLCILVIIVVMTITMLFQSYQKTAPSKYTLDYLTFEEYLKDGRIDTAQIIKGKNIINLTLDNGEVYSIANPQSDDFRKTLLENGVTIDARDSTFSDELLSLILTLPMTILMVAFTILILRYFGGASTTNFQLLKNEKLVTFDEVAGLGDIKAEVQFAVDTLLNYKTLANAGARPTKGIILEGPPGTGKTLIAKAIAGEAKVPFISTSGSDFVEMFAGLGASRVRALWELAVVNAPCVIFIDEIDAVGRRRQTANSGAQMESNQTLNALLQKMDGLGGRAGILVIGATNMVEDLDPALIRPGRFDRQIYIGPPKTSKDRIEIINVHTKHKTLDDTATPEGISKLMMGMTGAEIEASLNEAVMVSLRNKHNGIISIKDIDEAVMKLRAKGVVTSLGSEEEQKRTAVHEAGHAVISASLGIPVSKVSIVPYSSGIGGMTVRDSETLDTKMYTTREDIIKDIEICLAGQAAEKMILGSISSGCSSDLDKATDLAMQYVGVYGMDDDWLLSIKTTSRIQGLETINKNMALKANKLLLDTRDEVDKLIVYYRKQIEYLSTRLLREETIIGYSLDN